MGHGEKQKEPHSARQDRKREESTANRAAHTHLVPSRGSYSCRQKEMVCVRPRTRHSSSELVTASMPSEAMLVIISEMLGTRVDTTCGGQGSKQGISNKEK